VICDLRLENQSLSKEIWKSTGLISRERSVNRFLKLDFTEHDIMESLSEFGLSKRDNLRFSGHLVCKDTEKTNF
jgi:hypothetical protein